MITSMVQLLCRMTKLCWYDDDAFRTIVDDAKAFLAKGSSGSPVRAGVPFLHSPSSGPPQGSHTGLPQAPAWHARPPARKPALWRKALRECHCMD